MYIITMSVNEMASVGAMIGSSHDGSVIQACRVGRSLVLVDLVDLVVRNFKHYSDLGDIWRLFKPSELVSGHGQVGTWGLVDFVAIDTDKFVVEVAVEWAWPPL